MSLNNIFQISSQGMSVQRERLEAAASNLANSNTTRTSTGGPYRRRDVVVESISISEADATTTGAKSFGSTLQRAFGEKDAESVRAKTLVAETAEGAKRYMPDHPDADAKGYVTMPDVDPLEETVNMMSAARAFEANATAFNTAKEMARASLRLGDA